MARISYTEKEVELLARLIKSEALGEGEEGMLLVGNVVVNRVVANCDICLLYTSSPLTTPVQAQFVPKEKISLYKLTYSLSFLITFHISE